MLTPSPLLDQVVAEYFQARQLRLPHPRVTRGESRSVSAEVEDIFAFHVAQAAPALDHIYVNQTLSATKESSNASAQRLKPIKPDLVLCKGQQIRLLIDMKMDLNRYRNHFKAYAETRAGEVSKLRGRTVSLREKQFNDWIPRQYVVHAELMYVYVVISDSGVDTLAYRDIENHVRTLPEIALFTLVRGTHPNLYRTTQNAATSQVLAHASKSDFTALSSLIAAAAA